MSSVIYVLLAVAVCVLAGGLCAFFLYPRDVKLDSQESMALLQPDEVHYRNNSVDFVITTYVNIINDNYYPTPVKSIAVSVMMNKKELARRRWDATDSDHPQALARSRVHLPVNVTFHLTKAQEPQLVERCDNQSPWVHNLVMTFV
ncbi:transmembrane protein 106B [Elysia marginata]|uniref:Transmembrane protein 106B n=1 Tax=Elysia marginata TaxID=1093978 RepID=A0AAV4H1H1_9GAST|nr:transmembrane protein 106B [Elysia marginata]